MEWSDIVGHDQVIAGLKALLTTGRFPHALLFHGPAGVGKFTTARIMAAGALCHGEQSFRPCGVCRACRMSAQGTHPDLLLIEPDGAAIKIDQIRALQHTAALSPALGRGRACIIDNAELMTTQAANSLLKLLEEPPPGFLFILAAQNSRPLLPTILSRCCRLAFQALPASLATQVLLSRGFPAAQAAVAARLSGGSLGKALELVSPEGLAARNQAAAILAAISRTDGLSGLSGGEALAGAESLNAKAAGELLEWLQKILRDGVILAGGYDRELIWNVDMEEALFDLTACWDEERLLQAMAMTRETGRAVNGNANVRLSLEGLWIRMGDLAKGECSKRWRVPF